MVAWGVVMTLMGIVQNYHGLLAARLFLGVTEAGLYPGVAVSWLRYPLVVWSCRLGLHMPVSSDLILTVTAAVLVLSNHVVLST